MAGCTGGDDAEPDGAAGPSSPPSRSPSGATASASRSSRGPTVSSPRSSGSTRTSRPASGLVATAAGHGWWCRRPVGPAAVTPVALVVGLRPETTYDLRLRPVTRRWPALDGEIRFGTGSLPADLPVVDTQLDGGPRPGVTLFNATPSDLSVDHPGQPDRRRRRGRGRLVPPGRPAHLRRPPTARRRSALQRRQHRRSGDRRAGPGRPRLDDHHAGAGRTGRPLRPPDLCRRRRGARHPPPAPRGGVAPPQRELPRPQPGGAHLPGLRGPRAAHRSPSTTRRCGPERGDVVIEYTRRARSSTRSSLFDAIDPRDAARVPAVQSEDRRHRHRRPRSSSTGPTPTRRPSSRRRTPSWCRPGTSAR